MNSRIKLMGNIRLGLYGSNIKSAIFSRRDAAHWFDAKGLQVCTAEVRRKVKKEEREKN
jgi:hypothetical protein